MTDSIAIHAPQDVDSSDILTAEALSFLSELHVRFGARRNELLDHRLVRREAVARGAGLDFLPETAQVREGDWSVAPIPAYLADRRVEITGPTDRKMTINALNSGAKVWLADLEDANTPSWFNVIDGQRNLRDAVRRSIALEQGGKTYALGEGQLAVIVPRPRGWHLNEKHLQIGQEQLVGALVDFGLYLFHNGAELIERGAGPAFYLPKMESHLEARLWAEVFAFSEDYLGLTTGTIRATVLIETIWAAFEMDEILYELKNYIAGLNAGRWDYLFSIVKTFRDAGPEFVLPDRNSITMTAPFMKAYSDLLVATCHRRGAYAIGGMAAFIPSRKDADINAAAFQKVRSDKSREAGAGYDGSWVAHPDLVPICTEIFDAAFGTEVNQLASSQPDPGVTAKELLDIASVSAAPTPGGFSENIAVALEYVVNWLYGRGAVGINNLMEDAATAEISRSLVWQWREGHITLSDGQTVTDRLITDTLDTAAESLADAWAAVPGGTELLVAARNLIHDLCINRTFVDFLTLPAYQLID